MYVYLSSFRQFYMYQISRLHTTPMQHYSVLGQTMTCMNRMAHAHFKQSWALHKCSLNCIFAKGFRQQLPPSVAPATPYHQLPPCCQGCSSLPPSPYPLIRPWLLQIWQQQKSVRRRREGFNSYNLFFVHAVYTFNSTVASFHSSTKSNKHTCWGIQSRQYRCKQTSTYLELFYFTHDRY